MVENQGTHVSTGSELGFFTGYDRRIKMTIDSAGAKVDSDLTDFPIMVYLSASSGIGNDDVSAVFDELTSDANRKKIAVTKSDGITELYVEIEKWDDANEQAWLSVKVAGANSISSSADTILYLYYDAWVGTLAHLEGLKSPPQRAMPIERATWQGEPVVAVLAESRAVAEDAGELVEIAWEPLPAATDMKSALDADAPLVHPDLGDNLSWRREVVSGDVDAAIEKAHTVVEETFVFGRHTGVTLEPRGIIADYEPSDERMTVYHSGQAPHNMQAIFAEQIGMPEPDMRVISKDVGGAFGLKAHTYSDEVATVALAKMMGRPVKFVADRLESFVSDIHARDHIVKARMAISEDGRIEALDVDDLTGIGPYSMFPRTSAIETNQILNLTGGQYVVPNYRARGTVVFQNKNMMCQYRAVGHPIATTIAEGLADLAADAVGLDPAEFRRRNLMADDAYPAKAASGLPLEGLSHHASLDKLLVLMDYDALRREQEALRQDGVYRGIGLASFIEVTNPSPLFYGAGGARVSATDGCTIRLDPSGIVTAAIGVTEQGQGTETVIAQVAATAVGVHIDQVRVLTGDTDKSPYGGGVWGSRGAGIGGEATLQAGKALRHNILVVASAILQSEPAKLAGGEGKPCR